MLLKHLFENEMMPPKAVAICAARMFNEMHRSMHEILQPIVQGFGNELNFDVEDHPDMRLFVTFEKTGMRPPKAELQALLKATTAKYHLESFKPMLAISKETAYDFWIEITFVKPLLLDEAALDAGGEELRKLGLFDQPNITVNL